MKDEIIVCNMTARTIVFLDETGAEIGSIESSGKIRLSNNTEMVDMVRSDLGFDIPVTETRYGDAHMLPTKKDGSIFIVSIIIAQAYPDRDDFYVTNETVRDAHARIIGCKSIKRNPFFRGGQNESED